MGAPPPKKNLSVEREKGKRFCADLFKQYDAKPDRCSNHKKLEV